MINLRSDTFTLPTESMMKAIQQAKLGDDVYNEDPTVLELEELAAEMLGKEAASFMPSGTMANLASIMAHCPRGSKVIVGDESDIYIYEAGGASVCGGIMYDPVQTQPGGILRIEDLEKKFDLDPEDPQFALPGLICLENTHNRCSGAILPFSYLERVKQFASEKKVPIHMDGARIFNAAVAMGVHVSAIAQYADSIQFCLSKGLSAPIGSMVVGNKEFITQVKRLRKMLGGGMRQVGIVAAPAIVALKEMVDRLAEDHENARFFAQGLSQLEGIEIDPEKVVTNIVLFRLTSPRFTWQQFLVECERNGLQLSELGYGRLRAVMHYGITREDVEKALSIIEATLKEKSI